MRITTCWGELLMRCRNEIVVAPKSLVKAGLTIAFSVILFCASFASIARANSVFSIGTGAMPDPFTINPATDDDLNPALALQGLSSFSDAGGWSTGASYKRGDYITVGGLRYVVLSDMVGGSSFSADITAGRFVLYSTASNSSFNGARFLTTGGYSDKGSWSAMTSYQLGDQVLYNGISYIATAAHFSSNFETDMTAGNWILVSSAPDLSLYNVPVPIGHVCGDFDSVFYEGTKTYRIEMPFHESNLNGTGKDLTGTLTLSLAFDWENETIAGSGDVKLTSFPAQSGGAVTFELANSSFAWLSHPFHTGNKCGRFKVYHVHSGYAVPNSTCFASTMLSFYTIVQFYEKSGQFVPVAYTYPLGHASKINDIEFYNSIFNDVGCIPNSKEHFATGTGGNMKVQ